MCLRESIGWDSLHDRMYQVGRGLQVRVLKDQYSRAGNARQLLRLCRRLQENRTGHAERRRAGHRTKPSVEIQPTLGRPVLRVRYRKRNMPKFHPFEILAVTILSFVLAALALPQRAREMVRPAPAELLARDNLLQ